MVRERVDNTKGKVMAEELSEKQLFWRLASPIAIAVILFVGWSYNPLEYVWETGTAAYSQAKQVCHVGAVNDCALIASQLEKGKLTMKDYSNVVFPAFSRIKGAELELMARGDENKSLDQLRQELVTIVAERKTTFAPPNTSH